MSVVVLIFWRNNLIVGSLLFLEFLVPMIFLYNNIERLFFLFVGVFGVVLEIVGGLVGIWTYTFPNLVTVPFWIFFCWGYSYMLLHSIYLIIKK